MQLTKRLAVHIMVTFSIIGLALYSAFPAHAVVSSRGKPTPTPTSTPTSLPTNTSTPTPVATPTPLTTPIPTPTCTASWHLVSAPTIGTGINQLSAVSGDSSNDVWAVGQVNTPTNPALVEHWNGSSWTTMTSPNSGAEDNILNSVTVVSSNDVWAVGMSDNPDTNGSEIPLALHWNGASWTLVGAPAPSGGSGDRFDAAVALGTNDVWAVGSTSGSSLTEQWNGSIWNVVSSPTPSSGGDLVAVSAAGVTDIWAVGAGPLTEHYSC